jgi:hypothetical protein
MMDKLWVYWDLIVAQCLPDWRSGAPTMADYTLVTLIALLFALACWQCAVAFIRGDGPEARRIKQTILDQERSHAD